MYRQHFKASIMPKKFKASIMPKKLHLNRSAPIMRKTCQSLYPNDPGMHNTPDNHQYAPLTHQYVGQTDNDTTLWQRVKTSFVAIIVGLVLAFVGCGVVFWNEGRAVQTSKSLEEGMRLVRPLHSTEVIFDENNGKLVHITGPLKTNKALFDEVYNIAVPAVKLKRKVEMYQWVEHENRRERRDGDEAHEDVSYSYTKEWRTELIRSSSFNSMLYSNPETFVVESKIYVDEDAQVGNFFLSRSLIDKITNFKNVNPNEPPKDPNVRLYHGSFYHSQEPEDPQVGDVRVTFEYAGLSVKEVSRLGPPDRVSIMGRQWDNKLETFHTEAGDAIEFLYIGDYSAEHIIQQEHMSNTLLLWGLRVAGWLLVFVGCTCITQLFNVLAERIPIVREFVAMGTVMASVSLSISVTLTVIAVGWIWYRPVLGITILVLACLPFALSKWRLLRRRDQRSV